MERLVKIRHYIRPDGQRRGMVLWLLLAILGAATVSHAAASMVSASLDPRSFSVDQAATLTITINDGDGTIGELPQVDGLDFERRGQSSQHQWMNGSLSSSVSTIYQVQAFRPGSYTIPSISITVDGKQLQTEAIAFEVTPAAAVVPQQGGGVAPLPLTGDEAGQLAFLRVTSVKGKSYVGEVLPLEIKAYFRRGLRASLNSQPRLNGDGFVLTQSNKEPAQTEEVVDNVPYAVLTWPGTLSGIKEGRQNVSITIEATLLLPDKRRRSAPLGGDPFFGNDIFADFFNQQQLQEKKIQIVSKDMALQVLPLPTEGKPADFSGAIGKFDLQVKAQPTEVGLGDPITLTMTVQGTGNFDRVDAPVLSRTEGWKSYSPSSKMTAGARVGQGSKVFEQAIVAKDMDKTTIPPLSFSFFDPEAGKYQTLRSDPIPLRVTKDENAGKNEQLSSGANGQGASNNTTAKDAGSGDGQGRPDGAGARAGENGAGQAGHPDASGMNLAPLHSQLGSLQQGLLPLASRTSFQIVALISFLLLVAVISLKIRARRLANNPALCRHREMVQLLEYSLREIEKSRQQGNTQDFLAVCRKAMQEQLGFIWQTEPGAITLADLRQRLAPDAELITLFATAESGAYVVESPLSRQEMVEYAGKLERELRQLQ
ncbi:MAG: BatD family protein [Desulfocapsaceae bacterium]|nr:BatD family protein [Desulfocapsaceae bacterium]